MKIKTMITEGKWYVDSYDRHRLLFAKKHIIRNDGPKNYYEVYGVDCYGECITDTARHLDGMIEATPNQILIGLKKAARRKGFRKGCYVETWLYKDPRKILSDKWSCEPNGRYKTMLQLDGFVVFRDGEWAQLYETQEQESEEKTLMFPI